MYIVYIVETDGWLYYKGTNGRTFSCHRKMSQAKVFADFNEAAGIAENIGGYITRLWDEAA